MSNLVERKSGKPVVRDNRRNREMQEFKYEVANDLGLVEKINEIGFPNMTSRECGLIGGNMTRRMIAFAKRNMPQMIAEERQLDNVIDVEDYEVE